MNVNISPGCSRLGGWLKQPGLVAATAATAALCLAVAACGLQKGAHPGCLNSRVHRAKAAAKACGRVAVRVRLDTGSAGVAAGTATLPLDFTNTSATPCRLAGFPVVTLATSRDGKQVGIAATADMSLAARALSLGAGQTAHIWLKILDVMNLPASQCQPVGAAGLRVALPGQSAATFISHALTTCAKVVPGADILTVEPFRLGQALPGTAQ